jgi:hypothetical protein
VSSAPSISAWADLRVRRVLLIIATGEPIGCYSGPNRTSAAMVADQISGRFIAGIAEGEWKERIVAPDIRATSPPAVEIVVANFDRRSAIRYD